MDGSTLLGTTIEGRYRIDTVISEGAIGVLYRGEHLRLDSPVAIKCLRFPDMFSSEAKAMFLESFRETCRILIKLEAPGLPRLYDFGASIGDRDHPFLVTEWLDGHAFDQVLLSWRTVSNNTMEGREAVELMLSAIDTLAVAHHSHLLHLDLKPSKLLLVTGPRGVTLKVLGLGLGAALHNAESAGLSRSASVFGPRGFSAQYAAPEQFAPKRYGALGPWTDVHALGLMLIELLTGRVALEGEDLVDCIASATAEERPSARARGAKISDELEAVLTKAVAGASADRFRDAGALASALREVPEAEKERQKFVEEFMLRGNPKGSHYDDGLVGTSSPPPNSGIEGYRDVARKTPVPESLRGNPKGSYYDDGLQRHKDAGSRDERSTASKGLPVVLGGAVALSLALLLGVALTIARRWGWW